MRSKQRVIDHGEVFTPPWLIEEMIDLVRDESERIDSRFLEPACGSGNFVVPILRRKLAAVHQRYGRSDFEKRHQALFSLMCIYGIELLPDNVEECRERLMEELFAYLGAGSSSEWVAAARAVVSTNIVHGDALTMTSTDGTPVTFAEWSYLGNGQFQRRDFEYQTLTEMSSFGTDSLFGELQPHEIFSPKKTYPKASVVEIGR